VKEIPRPTLGLAMGEGLCTRCFGRLFARLGHGYDNLQRGGAAAFWYAATGGADGSPEVSPPMEELVSAWEDAGSPASSLAAPADCTYCQGVMGELDEMADAVAAKLGGIEWGNFLMGSRFDPDVARRQDELWGVIGPDGAEHIKMEVNREVGKRVGERTGKDVEFDRPDVTVLLDTRFHSVSLQISSLFFYGRYRKLGRDIPQTRWPCRWCNGIGCRWCDFEGKKYPTSVEELVAADLMEASGAAGHAFHGMGREDIDALMLGEGRPFILELMSPRVRRLDIGTLMEATNSRTRGRVEVMGLKPTDKAMVQRLKAASPDKSYIARVSFAQPVGDEKLKMVEMAFAGLPIDQRTPDRVAHRRADLVRKRTVRDMRVEPLGPREALFHITAEAGTYIKELVSGDDGRTRPSVTGVLGVPGVVVELDVTAVHIDDGDI